MLDENTSKSFFTFIKASDYVKFVGFVVFAFFGMGWFCYFLITIHLVRDNEVLTEKNELKKENTELRQEIIEDAKSDKMRNDRLTRELDSLKNDNYKRLRDD